MGQLLTDLPEIAKQWDRERNMQEGLQLEAMTVRSKRKAWWLCDLGHSWKTSISSRTLRNTRCLYCSNQRVLPGFNDLFTLYPEVALQWHPTKNDEAASTVSGGTNKKAWWICNGGHEWSASIASRTKLGAGCPYCARIISLPGVNDLATTHPGIASQWHPSKNFPLTATRVQRGSDHIVWWQCEHGHEWRSAVKNRTRHSSQCPTCSKNKTSIRELALRYYLSKHLEPAGVAVETGRILNRQIDIIVTKGDSQVHVEYDGRRWHANSEKDRTRDEFMLHKLSNVRGIIRMREAGTSLYAPQDRVCIITLSNHEKSAFLDGVKQAIGVVCHLLDINLPAIVLDEPEDDKALVVLASGLEVAENIAVTHPGIAAQWHPTKNGTTLVTHVSRGVRLNAWWQCTKGHEWQASIKRRCRGNSACPYCSNAKVLPGYNDLATTHPEIASRWDHRKNGDLTPDAVQSGSKKVVWWRCSNGHCRQARISHMVAKPNACLYCSGQAVTPGENDLATVRPDLVAQWHSSNTRSITSVTQGSAYRARWICSLGHKWESAVSTRKISGCPICSGRKPRPCDW